MTTSVKNTCIISTKSKTIRGSSSTTLSRAPSGNVSTHATKTARGVSDSSVTDLQSKLLQSMMLWTISVLHTLTEKSNAALKNWNQNTYSTKYIYLNKLIFYKIKTDYKVYIDFIKRTFLFIKLLFSINW